MSVSIFTTRKVRIMQFSKFPQIDLWKLLRLEKLRLVLSEKLKHLKLDRIKDLLIKILAAACEAIVVFIVFNVLNQQLLLRSLELSVLIAAAAAGTLLSAYFENLTDLKKKANRLILSGVLICFLLSLASNGFYGLINILIEFTILLFIYYRSIKKYQTNDLYAYTISDFYTHIAIVLVVNYVVFWLDGLFWLKGMSTITTLVALYTILYVVIGILLLIIIKNKRFEKQKKTSKNSFEILLSGGILLSTFLLASPSIVLTLLNSTKSLGALLYSLFLKFFMILVDVIIYILELFYGKGMEHIPDRKKEDKPGGQPKPPESDVGVAEPEGTPEFDMDPPQIDKWKNIIITALVILAVLVIIYFIYRSIRKMYKKSQAGSNYVEDREFVLPSSLSKLSDFMNKMKNRIGQALKRFRLNINADNKEKLRYEYKIFLQKLYDKFILSEGNNTPQFILNHLKATYPGNDSVFEQITSMYEEVRYGERMPTNEELQQFKAGISDALNAILKDKNS